MGIIHKEQTLFTDDMDYALKVFEVVSSNKVYISIIVDGQSQVRMCIEKAALLEFMAHVTEALNL